MIVETRAFTIAKKEPGFGWRSGLPLRKPVSTDGFSP
jgi:hypothetical protein